MTASLAWAGSQPGGPMPILVIFFGVQLVAVALAAAIAGL